MRKGQWTHQWLLCKINSMTITSGRSPGRAVPVGRGLLPCHRGITCCGRWLACLECWWQVRCSRAGWSKGLVVCQKLRGNSRRCSWRFGCSDRNTASGSCWTRAARAAQQCRAISQGTPSPLWSGEKWWHAIPQSFNPGSYLILNTKCRYYKATAVSQHQNSIKSIVLWEG